MVLHMEIGGGDFVVPERTARKLEKAVAGMAMEVVMMVLVGQLVKGPQGRVIDLSHQPLFGQPLQVAIDRSLIEGLHDPASVLEDLLDAQRSALLANNLFDGCFLNRPSLHLLNLGFQYTRTGLLLQIN